MKIFKRLLATPFVFCLLLITHLFFVFKRTCKFIIGGGELKLNKEQNDQTV